jgi:hypothetical protein
MQSGIGAGATSSTPVVVCISSVYHKCCPGCPIIMMIMVMPRPDIPCFEPTWFDIGLAQLSLGVFCQVPALRKGAMCITFFYHGFVADPLDPVARGRYRLVGLIALYPV